MDLFDPDNLELTLKASNEGIWDWTVGSDDIYYSDRVHDFLGIEIGMVPNIMVEPEKILYKEDVTYFSNVLSLTLLDSDEELFAVDCRIIRPDGGLVWLRIRGIVVWENAKPVRIAGSIIDITKRKTAESLVSEERNRLRLVIDNIPLQVYFKDTESRYLLVNQRQADWVGAQNPKDLIGNTAGDYFSEETWRLSRAEEMKIMETGKPIIDVIQHELWPNRPATYVKKMKYPWYNSENQLLGTFGISIDVTQLVTAQKKLEMLALNLKEVNNKYEEELILAREIQYAILPENASDWDDKIDLWKNRINIEHLYIPATELAGDYYDIISIDENRIGFLILDVMGHGIRSALIVSLIRGLLEQALPFAADPATYIGELNRSLSTILGQTTVTMFASACYVVLDFEKGVSTVTCAGHDAPLIQFQNQNDPVLRADVTKDPALGFYPDVDYHETSFDLSKIEKMLLFTDGIYEISNLGGEEWGQEKLSELFEQYREKSISELQSAVYEKALSWTGENGFDDDVCLIGIELNNPKLSE